MSHKLIDGYKKAYNDNTPLVDVVMMGSFISKDGNFISPEIANVKAVRNGKGIVWHIGLRICTRKKNWGHLFFNLSNSTRTQINYYKLQSGIDCKRNAIRSRIG